MKKFFVLILILLTFCTSEAQSNGKVFTEKNFDIEFLTYKAIRKNGVSKESFDHAQMILSETKKALNNDVKNYNVAHYWNIATAFSTLKESKENIKIAFIKATRSNGVCEYFKSFKNVKNHFSRHFPDIYKKEGQKCLKKITTIESLDLIQYSQKNGLDLKLVQLFNQMNEDDKKYRDDDYKKNKSKQIELDKKNQEAIDSLFNEYQSYIGTSLVGEKFNNVMWTVVQHSNVDMMEKYLPFFQKAVKEKELDLVPFKMLIDRYYGLKYGFQIFGSQSGFGFELADEETRKKIIEKYNIE